jgi:hypothetical protein
MFDAAKISPGSMELNWMLATQCKKLRKRKIEHRLSALASAKAEV